MAIAAWELLTFAFAILSINVGLNVMVLVILLNPAQWLSKPSSLITYSGANKLLFLQLS